MKEKVIRSDTAGLSADDLRGGELRQDAFRSDDAFEAARKVGLRAATPAYVEAVRAGRLEAGMVLRVPEKHPDFVFFKVKGDGLAVMPVILPGKEGDEYYVVTTGTSRWVFGAHHCIKHPEEGLKVIDGALLVAGSRDNITPEIVHKKYTGGKWTDTPVDAIPGQSPEGLREKLQGPLTGCYGDLGGGKATFGGASTSQSATLAEGFFQSRREGVMDLARQGKILMHPDQDAVRGIRFY